MKKYALIGTSCCGKTTAVHSIVGTLRKEGYFIDGITSLDRNYTFDYKQLDTNPKAQAYVILQQAFNEMRIETRDDTDILLSDRSVVDYFAYMMVSTPGNVYCDAMRNLVMKWVKTYDTLFLLKPLPYVKEQKRPSDDFRMMVHNVLSELVAMISNVVVVPEPIEEREAFICEVIRNGNPKP